MKEFQQISQLAKNTELAQYTSLQVGGKADILAIPQSEEEVLQIILLAKARKIKLTVIGYGSNILVSDEGIEGLVILIRDNLAKIEMKSGLIRAEAGASLAALAAFAARHSLTGLEFACGIPGSVGGAVLMNAGAYDSSISDCLYSSEAISRDGELVSLNLQQHHFAYRQSFYSDKDYIIKAASFKLKEGKRQDIYAKMAEVQARRRRSQPLDQASAGSSFKRPQGYFVGPLIRELNLEKSKQGDASVSAKHAGFVVNLGKAKARDIEAVLNLIKAEVKKAKGIDLECEIKKIGRW